MPFLDDIAAQRKVQFPVSVKQQNMTACKQPIKDDTYIVQCF